MRERGEMGWLFGCFGYTKKRKRPKKASKFGPKSRRILSYQPLQSEVLQELGVSEVSSRSVLMLRNEHKEEKKAKIRKKVRFNLDVIAYEPIPAEDSSSTLLEDESDTNWGMTEEDTSYSSSSSHRYTNCYDNDHDDDDDSECGISDLDDDDDGDCLIDPHKIYYEEIAEEYQGFCLPLTTSGDTDLGTIDGSTRNVRFRSHYIVPVLNPIENISQWKALKRKENANAYLRN